jgi:hypothetical protein
MDYDRRPAGRTAKVQFESVLYAAAEADKHAHEAYLSLHTYKAGLDGMEEIPNFLKPIYSQTMKALDKVSTAIDETNQLREMTNKMLRSIGK